VRQSLVAVGLIASALMAPYSAQSARHVPASHTARLPDVLAVVRSLAAAPAGVSDLKFQEFFKLPVGPRGLEPTDKLLALDGKKIRVVGFMVRQDRPTKGMFVFTPMPLELGDEDESLSDDLPPSAVFVHVAAPAAAEIPYVPKLIKLTGTLQLGPQNEIDGHVSFVRLVLDEAPTQAIFGLHSSPETADSHFAN
jgi:hypothetical protein